MSHYENVVSKMCIGCRLISLDNLTQTQRDIEENL